MARKIEDYRVEECLQIAAREDASAQMAHGDQRERHVNARDRWLERAIAFEHTERPQIAPAGLTAEGAIAWRRMRDGRVPA